jgi:hypothetical protein
MKDVENVEFRCEKKDKNIRFIFTGDEEQVKRIYLEI